MNGNFDFWNTLHPLMTAILLFGAKFSQADGGRLPVDGDDSRAASYKKVKFQFFFIICFRQN